MKKGLFHKVGEGLYRYSSNGNYYARFKLAGKIVVESLETKDREEAKRKLRDCRDKHERIDASRRKLSLAQLCDEWLEAQKSRIKDTTLVPKQRLVRRIKRHWPGGASRQQVRDVRGTQAERFLTKITFGVSSYNNSVTALRQLFDYAVHDGCIIKNPCAYLKYRRREDPIRRTPSFEQFKAIVADVRAQEFNGHGADQSADFLEFLGRAGLGQAEAAAITCADVEFPANQFWVYRRKTSTRFPVPIFPWLRPLLERLCEGKPHDELLFNMSNGKKALAGACKRLGYPPFSQRSLRRMFITNAIQKGVDVRLIAQWQGHRDNGELILRTYGRKIDDPHHQRMASLITEEMPGNVVAFTEAQA